VEALPLRGSDPSAAKIGKRPIFVDAKDGMCESEIYNFEKLEPGNIVRGPAVIHTPITTIVLQDRQVGTMDGYRNVVIDFER
jgi:N-methylhydantoinase A